MAESFLNTEAAVTINVESEGRFESRVGFYVSGWKSFIGERKPSLTRFTRSASVVTPASPLFKRVKDLMMFSLAPDPFDIPLSLFTSVHHWNGIQFFKCFILRS